MEVNDSVQEGNSDQSTKQKGYFLPILAAIIVLILVGIGGYYFYQKQIVVLHQASQPISTQSPTTIVQPSTTQSATDSADMANWKTYENNQFSLRYPPEWRVDDIQIKGEPLFLSPDYQLPKEQGSLWHGLEVHVWTQMTPFGPSAILRSTTSTTWLNQPATLEISEYQGYNLILTTTTMYNNKFYQMGLDAPNQNSSDTNKVLLMQIANTLKPK